MHGGVRVGGEVAEQRFEHLLGEIEQLIADLEGGDLTLDQSVAKYEKAVKALKRCYEMLQKAEKRVEKLVKSADGSLSTKPFEPEAGEKAADAFA